MCIRIALSLLAFATFAASAAGAQITIDDFTTGAYQSPEFKIGVHASSQNGNMLGLNRSSGLTICKGKPCGLNPSGQPISYAFLPATASAPAAMVQSAGYGASPRFEVGYGFGAPMDKDLGSADRIRITFLGLNGTMNFNLQIFTGTSYGQNGCNLAASTVPLTVELPYSGFVGPGFDKSHVNLLNFIFQNGNVIGGINFAIGSIQAVNGGKPGAIVCHLN
jgi:hypothetical protein